MISISSSRFGKINKKAFNSKQYRDLSKIIITAWILFALLYAFRDELYNLNNQYITLFAETGPNFISSFLFTLISIFYALPYFKGIESINNPIFIYVINISNIIVFLLIEYVHVILKIGTWDNNDIVASLIGLIFATIIYFNLKTVMVKKYTNIRIEEKIK